jgi:Histidine kinase
MDATAPGRPSDAHSPALRVGWRAWLRTHRGAVAIAALLSLAVPVTSFVGNLGVMPEPPAFVVAELALWHLLHAVALGTLMLAIGYALQRQQSVARTTRAAAWVLGAAFASAAASLATEGRAALLIDQGVVDSARTMHLYAFVAAFVMCLLFFGHLQRSVACEEAAARLGTAQAAQREARRRMAQAQLKAVQARIDPQLLFDMLTALQGCYVEDPERAERLLDELIAFLRAALPRLRSASSSVACEIELANAYLRLCGLAQAVEPTVKIEILDDAMHARFPPGILLPLLSDTLRVQSGPCRLAAAHVGASCRMQLSLPLRPSEDAVARVQTLLTEVYGSSAYLTVAETGGNVEAEVTVPYEPA